MLEVLDFSKRNFSFGYVPWRFVTFRIGVGSTGSKNAMSPCHLIFVLNLDMRSVKPLNFP